MLPSVSDIAWLAGIIDGEGCFTVKSPIRRLSGARKGSNTSYQVWIVLCNTSKTMVDRAARILTEAGVHYQPIRKVWKGKRATRWQYWLHVARKDDVLRATELLLPHLTAKTLEAEIVAWFYRRACMDKQHKATPLEKAMLDCMSGIKRCGGEAPAEIRAMLREVIPSQAVLGIIGTEGVETRSVSPNNNLTQELPGPQGTEVH